MAPAGDLEQRVAELTDGVWALAALSTAFERGVVRALEEGGDAAAIAQRTGVARDLVQRLLDVLVALGIASAQGGRYRLADGAGDVLGDRAAADRLAAEARSSLLLAADLGACARAGDLDLDGWRHEDPEILGAQGISSSGAVPALAAVFPTLGDLAERLERPGAAALDVGTGVAAIALALCRRFPALHVVGLEPARAPLSEARRNVVAADMEDRVELRAQRVEDLTDADAFDFAFLPIVFLSTATVRAGLEAIHRALRPGGWVVIASLGSGGDELAPALARLRATLWGSEGLPAQAVRTLCEETGYADVRVIGAPPGATLATVAARRAA